MHWNIQVFGSCGSTQDVVREQADRGADEGYAAQALTMEQGRGRHGNEWDSPMGNLYLSFLLRPDCTPDEAGQIAFVTATALSDAVDLYIEKDHVKTLKWPNDILVDGKKLSGILLETQLTTTGQLEYLIVGVGVNILSPPEGRIGVQEIAKNRVAINVFRDDFLSIFKVAYKNWQEKGFAQTCENWLKQAHNLGQNINVRLPEVTYQGVFKGLNENGALEVEIDGELKIFTAGEIF